MSNRFAVGDLTIHRIIEQETTFLPALDMLPGLTPELLADAASILTGDAAARELAWKGLETEPADGPGGPGPEGSVMTIDFELDGQQVTALNGGPIFQPSEGAPLSPPRTPRAGWMCPSKV